MIQEKFIPIEDHVVEQILELRKQNLSYRKIEAKLGVSRETARNYCNKLIPEFRVKKVKARRKKKVRNYCTTRNKKPIPNYKSSREYDFLQYIRVVFKWATANTNLTRQNIEMLLYLYPRGAFTNYKFNKYHKIMAIYQTKTFDILMKGGWIYLWRAKNGREPALYTLSDKAKVLCDNMHKFSTGDKQIPTDNKNVLVKDKAVRINKYYLDIIKGMNKERSN
jgi:hypothetical protein